MENSFVVKDIDLVSTNDMYLPRPMKGGKKAYLTKSGALRKFQDKMSDFLSKSLTDEVIHKFNESCEDRQSALKLTIDFHMDRSCFFSDDISNYIKALEDCISRRLGIDDVRNCELHLRKFYDNESYVYVKIESYTLDFELDRDW